MVHKATNDMTRDRFEGHVVFLAGVPILVKYTVCAKLPWNRSPDISFIAFYTIFRAGAVRNGPGPNFGRKPARNRPKLVYRFEFHCWSPDPHKFHRLSRTDHKLVPSYPGGRPGQCRTGFCFVRIRIVAEIGPKAAPEASFGDRKHYCVTSTKLANV